MKKLSGAAMVLAIVTANHNDAKAAVDAQQVPGAPIGKDRPPVVNPDSPKVKKNKNKKGKKQKPGETAERSAVSAPKKPINPEDSPGTPPTDVTPESDAGASPKRTAGPGVPEISFDQAVFYFAKVWNILAGPATIVTGPGGVQALPIAGDPRYPNGAKIFEIFARAGNEGRPLNTGETEEIIHLLVTTAGEHAGLQEAFIAMLRIALATLPPDSLRNLRYLSQVRQEIESYLGGPDDGGSFRGETDHPSIFLILDPKTPKFVVPATDASEKTADVNRKMEKLKADHAALVAKRDELTKDLAGDFRDRFAKLESLEAIIAKCNEDAETNGVNLNDKMTDADLSKKLEIAKKDMDNYYNSYKQYIDKGNNSYATNYANKKQGYEDLKCLADFRAARDAKKAIPAEGLPTTGNMDRIRKLDVDINQLVQEGQGALDAYHGKRPAPVPAKTAP
ncbi:MAG: hypothetical protein LBF65_03060 [Holosporales bacterium]|jgi:hypothetical protein|nr:hypothetical protein [Holosporales bacterium]